MKIVDCCAQQLADEQYNVKNHMRVRAHMQKIYLGSADVLSAMYARKEGGRMAGRL